MQHVAHPVSLKEFTVIYVIVWVMFYGVLSSGISVKASKSRCDPGWFGSDCQYKSHYSDEMCSPSNCTKDSDCEHGWFGPACQYMDMATGPKATSNVPDLLNNKTQETCNGSSNIQNNVTVSFDDAIPFTWMRIYVIDPDSFKNLQLQFKPNGSDSTIECNNMRNASAGDLSLDIHCNLSVAVNAVIMKGEGIKSLCSIYISGGRNVALKQSTTQSSNYTCSTHIYSSDYAVDGNSSTKFEAGTCTHTAEPDNTTIPYWNLTFSHSQIINRYILYNRDRHSGRLKGFELESFSENGEKVFSYKDDKQVAQLIYTVTDVGEARPIWDISIRTTIISGSDCRILTLCEVEIYGDSVCPEGRYGLECTESCNCNNGETCFVSTGGCPSGCAPGFQGVNCNDECPPTQYGVDCTQNCSINCVDQQCHPTNGTCFKCYQGKSGEFCESDCPAKQYGVDCKENCSTNCLNQPCESTNGTCKSCKDGKTGMLCESEFVGDTDDPPVALIVGVVVACIVVIVIIAGLILFWRRRRRTLKENPQSSSVYSEPDENTTKSVKPKDRNYYNIQQVSESTAIAVEDLHDFILSHERIYFEDQFYKVPVNNDVAMTVGKSHENSFKNRYKNICAFDHTRVHLKKCPSKGYGDYINASFVEGYKGREKFIASQGPTKAMINDFVRMLWEQEIDRVVMLTNLIEEGKTKCEKYWPDDKKVKFGDITVKLTTTDIFADYTIRKLQLVKEGQPEQELTQFHFTSWTDKSIPNAPWGLVDFEKRVGFHHSDKPIVVHCSAGVGRTGTFIALRNLLKEAEDTGSMNFFLTLCNLRQERVMMIQTVSQYIFLHKAALVANLCVGTTIDADDVAERYNILESESRSDSGQAKLEEEFNAICRLYKNRGQMDDDDVYHDNTEPDSLNRFEDILPKEKDRPFLACDNSDMRNYINAVFVPSLTKKDQNILTQLPLPATVCDFWRMVTQYKVSVIVAFELDLKNKDKTIVDFLPASEDEPISCPPFDIKTGPITLGDCWVEQKLTVTKNRMPKNRLSASSTDKEEHRLTSFNCTAADLGLHSMLALIKQIRIKKPVADARTVFMCRNGAEYSGLVCVLSLVLDRLDHDQRLTVPVVLGTIKEIRPQVISTLSQYKFVYEALQRYILTQNSYNNVSSKFFKASPENRKLSLVLNDGEKDPSHVYATVDEDLVEDDQTSGYVQVD